MSPIGEEAFSFPWSSAEYGNGSRIQTGVTSDGRNGTISPIQQIGNDQPMPWEAFLENEDTGSMVMRLMRDNWCLLKHLHFDGWVQHAVGAPSAAITIFQSYHNRLSFSLFRFLCQFPAEAEKYTSIARVGKRRS